MKTKEFEVGQKAFIVYKERHHLPFEKKECTVIKVGNKYVHTDRAYSAKYEESIKGDKVNYLVSVSHRNSEEFLFRTEKEANAFMEIDYMKKRIAEAVSARGLNEMSDDKIRNIYDVLTKQGGNEMLDNIKIPFFYLGQKIWVLCQIYSDDHTEICEGEIVEVHYSYEATETLEDSKEWIQCRFTHPRYGVVLHESRVDNSFNKVVFATFQDAKDYLATHREADAWMYDKQGNLIRDYLDKAQVVGVYEDKLKVPHKERVTKWFISLYEIKNGVTKEKFFSVYEKAK